MDNTSSSRANKRFYYRMSSGRIQWADVQSDDSEGSHEANQGLEILQSAHKQGVSSQPMSQYLTRDQGSYNRYNDREQQRAQQLRQLDQLEGDWIWVFIFRKNSSNAQLQEEVLKLKPVKLASGTVGWQVKVARKVAKELLMEGFKNKRVSATIHVGRRNHSGYIHKEKQRYKEKDEPNNPKKYVEKIPPAITKSVSSKFTSQGNGGLGKQRQASKGTDGYREKPTQSSYKEKRQDPDSKPFQAKQFLQLLPLRKALAEKTPPLKYKEKLSCVGSESLSTSVVTEETQKVQVPYVQNCTFDCSPQQQECKDSTGQKPETEGVQKPDLCPQFLQSSDQQSSQQSSQQVVKPKKKKKSKRSKQTKPKKVSNNPFDRLG